MKQIFVFAAVMLGAVSCDITAQELASDSQLPVAPALTPAEPDPEATAAKVTRALEESKGVPASDISVSTHAGTIILTGEVNSEAARSTANSVAEKAAEGTRVSSSIEVRAVEDRPLQVQQSAQHSAHMVSAVESALKADPRTANLGVAVTSGEGHAVVLQGLVPTRANRTVVQSVAAGVKGVTRVDNRLQVPGE